jgi:hypothetical protein
VEPERQPTLAVVVVPVDLVECQRREQVLAILTQAAQLHMLRAVPVRKHQVQRVRQIRGMVDRGEVAAAATAAQVVPAS